MKIEGQREASRATSSIKQKRAEDKAIKEMTRARRFIRKATHFTMKEAIFVRKEHTSSNNISRAKGLQQGDMGHL